MSGKQMALLVVILNLVVFGLIELMSLGSLEIMTAGRILCHVGFVMNIVLLIVVLMGKPRV